MTLLDIYKTDPERLLNVGHSDFDDAQWHDLAIHLGSYQRDPYHTEVMQRILPIIGNRVLWLTTTSAQQFLYTAIFENDAKMVAFILNNFENVRNGEGGIDEWLNYLETVVEILHKCELSLRNYTVLNLLLAHFNDINGSALLFCVRENDRDLFDRVLPHSDRLGKTCAYCWTKVYGLSEFEQILEPISCKIQALYDLEFEFITEDKNLVAQAARDLYEHIMSGHYDDEIFVQLFKLGLTDGCNWGVANIDSLSPLERQKMVLLLSGRHKTNARSLLTHIDGFDEDFSSAIVSRFKDTPELVGARLNPNQRQKELCHCAYTNDKEFAQHLIALGADLYQVLERLMGRNRHLPNNSNVPLLQDMVEQRNTAANVVQHWINEQQAQTIHSAIDMSNGQSLHRKI